MTIQTETIEATTYLSVTNRGVQSTVCLDPVGSFYQCVTSRKSSGTTTTAAMSLAEMRSKSKAFAALADAVEGEVVA